MQNIKTEKNNRVRILVVIASYGNSNDRYLLKLIDEYRSMPFDVDIVILSNVSKEIAPDIELVLGLPNRNPWSLPFSHKQIFANRVEHYDLFIYTEDDILITEKNLRGFLEVSPLLRMDEIVGFLRIERGASPRVNYPEVHGNFHWNPSSVRTRGGYILAHFSNEHAGCYVLSQDQLRHSIISGGFLLEPHEWKYDLLCSAATDPYTMCGFLKLIPISHLGDFTVEHLPSKYVGKMGVDGPELQRQIDVLMRIATTECNPITLFNTETRLRRGMYSKDYYEPVSEALILTIPKTVRSVLSIGCGWGATERLLAHKGLRVVALPLDNVIAGSVEANGIELVSGDFLLARRKLEHQRFDCILFLDVLQLVPKPAEVLSLFSSLLGHDSIVVIKTLNMLYYPRLWENFNSVEHLRDFGDYEASGVHFVSRLQVRRWCRNSRLMIESMTPVFPRWNKKSVCRLNGFLSTFCASEFITVAREQSRQLRSRPEQETSAQL